MWIWWLEWDAFHKSRAFEFLLFGKDLEMWICWRYVTLGFKTVSVSPVSSLYFQFVYQDMSFQLVHHRHACLPAALLPVIMVIGFYLYELQFLNKLFLLQVALVRMFYHNSRKVTDTNPSVPMENVEECVHLTCLAADSQLVQGYRIILVISWVHEKARHRLKVFLSQSIRSHN